MSDVNDVNVESPAPPATHRGLGRATSVAIVATLLPIIGSLSIPTIGLMFAPSLAKMGWGGVAIFASAFALLGAAALAPTYTTSMIAGWTFGFARGFPAVAAGLVIGAVFCYLGAKRLAYKRVASTFAEHPKWNIVRRALLDDKWHKTLWIVFLLRLSPVLPFGTTNVLLATTGVPLGVYIVGTVLGLTPRIALIALAAQGAERLDLKTSESWWLLAGGLGATAICIFVLAVIGKRALERATRRNTIDEADA